MTMIPPKIKKLPKLHKPQVGYIAKPQPSSMNSNRGTLYQAGMKKMGNS